MNDSDRDRARELALGHGPIGLANYAVKLEADLRETREIFALELSRMQARIGELETALEGRTVSCVCGVGRIG